MVNVSIVGTGGAKILSLQVSVKILEPVDNGWITFKPHPLFEAVEKNRCDYRPFLSKASLLFHYGGQGYYFP